MNKAVTIAIIVSVITLGVLFRQSVDETNGRNPTLIPSTTLQTAQAPDLAGPIVTATPVLYNRSCIAIPGNACEKQKPPVVFPLTETPTQ